MLATRRTLLQSMSCSRGATSATCRTMHSRISSDKPTSPALLFSKSATTSSSTRLPLSNRHFSISASLSKKGGKAAREASRSEAATPSSSSSSPSSKSKASGAAAAAEEDAEDFTALESEISKCIERLRADLSKLRAGGRFNPEVLEALKVQVSSSSSSHGGKADKTTVKLGDVAQVVPKGRTVTVIVGEAEHLKPVSSAIQSSSLSLTPQPDPTGANPLALHIPIPPPTAESRRAAVQAATRAGEAATTGVRSARAGQQKKLRAAQVAKTIRPDDLKKAGVAMEKVVERGLGEVKKVVDGARKALDV